MKSHGRDGGAPGNRVPILNKIWATWKRVGRFIGDLIARVVLSLFYFTLFVPFVVVVRLFSDSLGMKIKANPSWWLDLLPVFREACQEAPPGEICGPEGRYLWAEMWMHPSALGHRLMAKRILTVLQEEGWHCQSCSSIGFSVLLESLESVTIRCIDDAGVVVKRWFSSISRTSRSNWMAWTAIPLGLAWRMEGIY